MKLYFDSFVYDLIQRRGESAEVRRWRRANGHEIGVSIEANIVEALRIEGNDPERDARVATMLRVGTPIHPPYDYRHYREIADELWRLRPGWFRRSPDRQRITSYLRKRKREWRKVKDPSQLPDLKEQLERIRLLIGLDMGRQKLHRLRGNRGIDWLPEHSVPDIQECIDRRSTPDLFWRYVGAEETRPSFDSELRRNGHLEWLVDFSWPRPGPEWDRFWMCEADAIRMPICRIVGLGEYFQRRKKVTPGNPMDRIGHAPHLLDFHVVVTTDRRFAEVLSEVRAEMRDTPLGDVILIDSEAPSALHAIQEGLRLSHARR